MQSVCIYCDFTLWSGKVRSHGYAYASVLTENKGGSVVTTDSLNSVVSTYNSAKITRV